MNTQSCRRATPPSKTAGPNARAGLTAAPVSVRPTSWVAARANPIATPAVPGFSLRLVTTRTTRTNRKVSTTSNTAAPPRLMWAP